VRFEFVQYWPTKKYVSPADARKNLPPHLREALLQDPKFHYGIYVDASERRVIEELDRTLEIGESKDFVKQLYAEVDEKEISNYTHFFIAPKVLEQARDVFFDMKRPDCKTDFCPWGARIVPPVKISPTVVKRLGIGEIHRNWELDLELVVSPQVKSLFDSHEITGLAYEPCEMSSGAEHRSPRVAPAYVARIEHGAYQRGSDMKVQLQCKEHSVVHTPHVFDRETPREALGPYDFQLINKLRIENREYYYYSPDWVVSRRALQLLLDNRVPGLETATWILNEKFCPLITC
jgi:hypothetical protein